MEKIYKSAQIIAIIFGVLIPCILLAGYVYYLGYTSAFGIDSSLMNRGFGEVIAESWFMGARFLVYLSTKWWFLLLIIAAAIIGGLGALVLVIVTRAKGIDILSKKINKENQGRTILGVTQSQWLCLWSEVGQVINWVGSILAVFLVAFALVFIPAQLGDREAKAQIEHYQEQGCEGVEELTSPARCINLVDISSPFVPIAQGFMITANTERVAIFNKNGLEVWPLLDSYVIRKSYVSAAESTETSE